MHDRAAQFSHFAAVVGCEDRLKESERLTDDEIELSEEAISLIDMKLKLLAEHIDEHPTVEITYFIPDERKTGGAYRTVKAAVKKIDMYRRVIRLGFENRSDEEIPISRLTELSGKWFEKYQTEQI